MSWTHNVSLKPYNTFGMDVLAAHWARVSSVDELPGLMAQVPDPSRVLILGGGSNVLLTGDVDRYVLHNEIPDIELIREEGDFVYVKSGAGVVWHDLVMHSIDRGWAGIENLSLIPGSVGAAPMQNIGAYGVELKEVFHELEAWHLTNGSLDTFSHADCEFGYRESVFKRRLKGKYFITSVTLKLSKTPRFQVSYGAIEAQLKEMGVGSLSIEAVSRAVIAIRQSKLPDPRVIGNAGSFFKNPVLDKAHFEELQAQYPTIPGYPVDAGHIKTAAGWLIEQAGWKGYSEGDFGVHDRQALVLVNRGHARGRDIYDLSSRIISDINRRFGIELEREVNII
ncbi:MAG: UDP-N-acetylmuramate dehydrogenase [Flavobacteriales bacterium]|nr:UDP-N-acetylmuramate dehydrogenase [Flavobacteriales bacterium]